MAPTRSNVEQLIRQRAQEHPTAVWLHWRDETYTWSDVLSASQRFAVGLRERGLEPGDRVAVLLPNCPEFLWAHFGILFAGGLSVPVNTSQRGVVLQHILSDSDVKFAVFAEELRDVVLGATAECANLTTLITLGGDTDARVRHCVDDLLSAADEMLPPIEHPGGVGIMYTSGTTGAPKGVVSAAYDLTALHILLSASGVQPGETIYTPLPLYHGNALTVSAIGSMLMDAQLALGERFSASRFWDECIRYHAVSFNALGGMIPILLKQPERPSDPDNPVRVVLSAGAPSDDRWPQFEKRFDVKLVEWFGMVDSPGNLINLEGRVGSMGKPMSGVTFSVLGDDGQEVGPGVVGELVFAHDKGRLTWYHNKPELTEQAYSGGWFHSGDLAETDIDGFFYYRGRKKESMRRRGENISSWEVETCVNRHPSVVESAAFGVPSDIGEDEVMVVIVPQPGVTIHPEEIIAWCSEHLAYFAVPRYVEFIDNLPKTDTQRVQYGVLKQRGRTENTWDREASGVTVVRR
ncbi:unannotated protein [freshwater metagenome]|uniref:Unannotated protein n=1 Tax=freshwater metagenome TaxID=449393 RepID=A0A6J7GWS6_9ZZZZ|nr:AMP-binding protein [Actinomycetota bacterium]